MNRRGFLKGAIAAAVVGPAVAKEAVVALPAPIAPPNAVMVSVGSQIIWCRIPSVTVYGIDQFGNPLVETYPRTIA